MKYIISVIILTIIAISASCDKKAETAHIDIDDMFPSAKIFGDDCSINLGSSGRRTREVLDGTYKGSETGGDMPALDCVYKNPDIIITVKWCEKIETASSELQKYIETTSRSTDITMLEGYGLDGFICRSSDQFVCVFQYGNLRINLLVKTEDELKKVLKNCIQYFDSVAK